MKTKIFYNGRRINGRFDSLKAKLHRATVRAAHGALSVVVLALAFALGGAFYSTDTIHAEGTDNSAKMAFIEALKNDLVSTLSDCERAGKSEDDAPVTYDNNKAGTLSKKNIPSFGILQFKVSTVQMYEKQRSGRELTNKEAITLALDADSARDLAKYVIFEKGGLDNWHNCAVSRGLFEQVKFIKKAATL